MTLKQLKQKYFTEGVKLGYKKAILTEAKDSTYFDRVKRRAFREIDPSLSLEDKADELSIIALQEGQKTAPTARKLTFTRSFYLNREYFLKKLAAILMKIDQGMEAGHRVLKPRQEYIDELDYAFAVSRGM